MRKILSLSILNHFCFGCWTVAPLSTSCRGHKRPASAKSPQSCPTLCYPITAAHQAPPSLGFSRQEHWSGLPFPSPMDESEKWKWSRSVVSDSSLPHGLQPTRLLHPRDFPGKSTGVGNMQLTLDLHSSFLSLDVFLPITSTEGGKIW